MSGGLEFLGLQFRGSVKPDTVATEATKKSSEVVHGKPLIYHIGTMDRIIPLAQSAGVILSMRHGITHRSHETPDANLPYGFRCRYYPRVIRKHDRKVANELQRRADDLFEKIADLLVNGTK